MRSHNDVHENLEAQPAPNSLNGLAWSMLRTQFAVLQANEAGTRVGADPEGLHDMRVATRRLRAPLRCFADVLPPEADLVRQGLSWRGRALSTVRDLDVQLTTLEGWRDSLTEGDQPAFDALVGTLHQARDHARQELLTVLDSERYAQLL